MTNATIAPITTSQQRNFSADEKIRIVLKGLRGDEAVSELCRREGVSPWLYYHWCLEFLEAGKSGLRGAREHDGPAGVHAESWALMTS